MTSTSRPILAPEEMPAVVSIPRKPGRKVWRACILSFLGKAGPGRHVFSWDEHQMEALRDALDGPAVGLGPSPDVAREYGGSYEGLPTTRIPDDPELTVSLRRDPQGVLWHLCLQAGAAGRFHTIAMDLNLLRDLRDDLADPVRSESLRHILD
jgi:hypothetical protein